MQEEEKLLTAQEAAEFFRDKSLRSVEWLVATNQIPYIRHGKRRVRFLKSDLLEYVRRQRVLPEGWDNGGGDAKTTK